MNLRFRSTAFFISLAAAAVLAACAGGKSIDVGDDSTTASPTPTGSPQAGPPSRATFDAKVEPFLETNTCGRAGCHIPPTGTSNFAVTTAAPNAAAKTANYDTTKCTPRLSAWGATPAGNFLSHFCTNATTPSAPHSGVTATATNCTDFYNWAKEGSGTPPAC